MLQSKNKLFKIAIPFFFSYIASVLLIISFGYIIKNQKEIEEYKQLTSWYENFDETKYSSNFQSFIKDAQKKIKIILNNQSNNPSVGIEKNIYDSNENSPQTRSVKWKNNIRAFYDNTRLINFNPSGNNNEEQKSNKVFQNFTQSMKTEIQPELNNPKNSNELDIFSKVLIKYLTKNDNNDDKYSNMFPSLKINNIYIFNKQTHFIITYPYTNEKYKSGLNYTNRPWYRTTLEENKDCFF